MHRPNPAAILSLILAASAAAQSNPYRITFNLTADLNNVFVSAHEWNGQVYAWDLFPIALGTVHAGTTTLDLGSHNVVAWAVFATSGPSGVATSINDSLSALPNNQSFEAVFPGYSQPTIQSNIATFYNGAYNLPQGYILFDFVLTNEDTIKSDFATGSLHMFTFSPGTNIGSATIFIPPACYANCDSSTTPPVLNVLDFSCFLNKFASGDPTANCDNSTTPPVLNVLDFSCFLNRFAAGCT